jgi:hypothetical protein
MNWEKPYVILRTKEGGECEQVHEADTIKDARYWLNYIAEPGDAIFKTPAHPKHENSDKLEYKAHLISRKDIGYDEQSWLQMATKDGVKPKLPN